MINMLNALNFIIARSGLFSNVIVELTRVLNGHELFEVKVAIADRDIRTAAMKKLATKLNQPTHKKLGRLH